MQKRVNVWVAILSMAISSWGCHAFRPSAPRELVVERVELVGDFTTNALSYGRDAGNSIRMDDDVLWVFGDTFTWADMYCATAAWSTVDRPTELSEPVDIWFGSLPFYRFSPEEAAYNESRNPPECCGLHAQCEPGRPYCRCPADADCTTRIALWPGDLLALDEGRAVQLYEKVQIGSAPWDFHHLGTGVATVGHGDIAAERSVDPEGNPLLVFGEREPNFLRAVSVDEESRRTAYLYAVTNRHDCGVDITLARVELADIFDRDAYQFWSGGAWSSSLDDAVPILRQINGGLGSVTWNDHLGAYLSALNDICTGGSALILRTAPRPEGPWSKPVVIDISPLGATVDAYAGQIHSSLGSGRDLVFTFYQPDPVEIGRVRIGRLRLR